MVASAAGTVEEPGQNVAAKSGLNRAILDAGWSLLINFLRYKLAWVGGRRRTARKPALSAERSILRAE